MRQQRERLNKKKEVDNNDKSHGGKRDTENENDGGMQSMIFNAMSKLRKFHTDSDEDQDDDDSFSE